MRPRIGVVFPQITDEDIKDIEIEKISVSKNRRKLKIILGNEVSLFQITKIENQVKSACRLSEVIVNIDKKKTHPKTT